MASRYFYEGKFDAKIVELAGSQAHHLLHVKRAKLHERVELFNGQGDVAIAEVVELKKKIAILDIKQHVQDSESDQTKTDIVLASAIPKADRFRLLIEKATEIGVTRLIPLATQRCVVLPRESKLDKHRQYVIEACKQSGRNLLMEISSLTTLNELLNGINQNEEMASSTHLIAGRTAGGLRNSEGLFPRSFSNNTKTVLLIVGPEGGLTEQEYQNLENHGADFVCCSANILRTETAGIVLASLAISALQVNAEQERVKKRGRQ